jgi:alcohol dehydrogenase class IV
MINTFEFATIGRINFQPGSIKKLGEEVKTLRGRKALLVTDKGVRNSGILAKAIESLEKEGLPFVVFDEVEPNPSLETAQKGYALFKEKGCDTLVAVGGGSPIDTAKAIGIQATNPEPLLKYEGANKVANPLPPLIALPTTAGTGSEVTGAAVITDRARKYKVPMRSSFLIPKVALLDPEVLATLPPQVLASTGMDALTHACETYVSTLTNPLSQGLAYESIRLIGKYLRPLYANPDNREAQGYMMLASTMAGMAFFNGRLGAVHTLAHPLGGFFDIPHGLANAILLPHCMDFSRMAAPDLFARIAEALGKDIRGLTAEEASRKAAEAVREILVDTRIPTRLREVGAKKEAFEAMANDGIASGIHLSNPRRVTLEDAIALYEAAF